MSEAVYISSSSSDETTSSDDDSEYEYVLTYVSIYSSRVSQVTTVR